MSIVSFENITTSKLDVNGNNVTDTLNGVGHFDKLMKALRAHTNEAVENNEITQAEAGAIYTGVIPSLIAEAVRFELGVGIANVQIGNEVSKNSAMLAESLAKLDKEMGYGSAKIADGTEPWYIDADGVQQYYEKGSIILGAPDLDGMIDKQVLEVEAKTTLTNDQDAEVRASTVRQDELADSKLQTDTLQRIQLEEEIDLLQSQDLKVIEEVRILGNKT